MATTYPTIFSDSGLPDQEAYLYALVNFLNTTTNEYADITQSVVASIAWAVKTKVGGTAVANGTFTVSDVIFDSGITDPDGNACNFRARFAGTCFPNGGVTYQVRVVITLTGSPADTTEIVCFYTTKPVV